MSWLLCNNIENELKLRCRDLNLDDAQMAIVIDITC